MEELRKNPYLDQTIQNLWDTPALAPSYDTRVPANSLQTYLLEVQQYKVLSREEQTELAVRVKEENDQEAAYRLVTSNLRLVVKIAMDFSRYWTKNLLDLIQEGNIGLLHAVKKFDPYRGIKFSYYASFWIKAYILKFIMDNWKLVKIGTTQAQRKLFFNLSKERDRLLAQGFEPEPRLLAERLDMKEEEVAEMSQRLGKGEVSIDTPIGDDSRESYGAFLPAPNTAVDEQVSQGQRRELLKEKIEEFRHTLTEKEVDIFDNRIMADKALTLQVLAERHQLSRERIRQIEEKIIQKVKRWLSKHIPSFHENYSDALSL